MEKTIEEIFSFEKKSKIKAGEGQSFGQYKFFTSSDIQSKFYDEYLFENESLIFGTGGNPSLHYCNEKFSTSTDCFVLTSKNDTVLTKYVYYYLRNNMNILEKGFKGAGIKHISKKYLQNIILKYPQDITIQQNIVQRLENIEKLINYKTKSMELMDEYIKSVFFKLFGNIPKNDKKWDIQQLNEIVSFETKSIKPIEAPKNLIYVGLENIKSNSGELINLQYNEEVNLKSNKYLFNDEMVLFGKLRPYLNKVALPTFDGLCSTDIIPLLPNNKCNKFYLKYLLSHDYYVELATLRSTGANLPRIKPKTMKKFEIPVPTIDKQKQFENIIIQTEAIKQKQIENLNYLNKLFEINLEKYMKSENYVR